MKLSNNHEFLSLCVVTHIDSDHISGIVKLFEENKNNEIITIKNIWHNSFRHLQLKEHVIDNKSNENYSFPSYLKEEIKGQVKISGEQGSNLASLVIKSEIAWNKQFDGNAVEISIPLIVLDNSIRIRLLSPNKDKLDLLYKFWKKELYKKGLIDKNHTQEFWDDAFEFLLAKEKQKLKRNEKQISDQEEYNFENILENPFEIDDSSTNGSSISFILEINDKKILMLGDSHPDIIVENLKKIYDDFPIQFDLIKLSHHGSFANNSPELLTMIDSNKFVFSTNGGIYNHPDIETVAWIVTKKDVRLRTLYFNYELAITNKLMNDKYKEKYNYNIITPEFEEPLEINL
jgi:beta-lactamase superfamily II metal-dependent hydrolase